MEKEFIYLKYITSFKAIHDPYFDLQICRQIENNSLTFALLKLKAKTKRLKLEILKALK